MTTDNETGEREARAILATLCNWYAARTRLESAEVVSIEVRGTPCVDADSVDQLAREAAYSVEVRSGWQSAGMPFEAGELRIMLAGNSPTVWLRAALDGDCEPDAETFYFEHSGSGDSAVLFAHPEHTDALAWFAGLFYFGPF